ncbi:hypothetical protein B0H13DRAFT_1894461 [Mycena leptocephala]|nr:hypothetical protein B0H13DRAFT_1894461 [Mycena leptocephala]
MNLISLLSLLPVGIRAEDVIISQVLIPDVRFWQSWLVRTSLAYIDVKGRTRTLNPIREYIRRVHPPSPSVSRPLRIYFQELLEVWSSTQQLASGNLSPDLIAYVGNINELMRHCLSTDLDSACMEIANGIITLDNFSATMVQGHGPLLRLVPDLIELSGDHHCDGNTLRDASAILKCSVQYFNTGTQSPKEAVHFYNALARYHLFPNSFDFDKAKEFNETAIAFAQKADDIDLQVACLKTELYLAFSIVDPYKVMKVVDKTRSIGRLPSNSRFWKYVWSTWEAWASCHLGYMSHALVVCMEAHSALTSMGLEGSDFYLDHLDLQADIHTQKTEYLEARRPHAEIVKKTSPTCSPWYHANSLFNMVQLDILTQRKVTDIGAHLEAAEAVYAVLGRPKGVAFSWLSAELDLYRGDIISGRAALIVVLSRRGWTRPDILQQCLAALGDPRHRMHGTSDTFEWVVTMFGDEEMALVLYHAGLQGGTTMDVHRLRAECMVGIGDILNRRGGLIQAKEMWEGAHPPFLRSSRVTDATAVEERLEQLLYRYGHLQQPKDPLPMLAVQIANVGHTITTFPTVALAAQPFDVYRVESSLGRLAMREAPSDSTATNIEKAVEPNSKSDGQTKLAVLD